MKYPHARQRPDERERGRHLSGAGGSAGSGVGAADLLDAGTHEDAQGGDDAEGTALSVLVSRTIPL